MKRLIALGAVVAGGVIAVRALSRARPGRLSAAMRLRMFRRMEHMMASLPESSPPRLVRSILPQLREQNEQIIRMLREQNELLRAREPAASGRTNPL